VSEEIAPSTEPAPVATEADGSVDVQATAQNAGQVPEAFDWSAHLNGEELGLIQNKHYNTPADLVRAYQHAVSKIGADPDSLVKLPDPSDNESLAKFFQKAGMPEDPAQYQMPENLGEDGAEWMRSTFHQAHLTADQANAMAQAMVERETANEAESEAAVLARSQSEAEEVKSEWGPQFTQKVELAKRGQALLGDMGLDGEAFEAIERGIGTRAFMHMLANLGGRTGEDSFVSGNQSNNSLGMTADQATAKLRELRADSEWQKQMLSDDIETRRTAMAQQSALFKSGARLT
jgi:hypothetical protein